MRAVRVATFNVRHCRGLDGRVDPGRTAAVIEATGASILALQELDRRVPRSGSVDQVAFLEGRIDMEVHFCPTLRMGRGEYGIALAGPSLSEVESESLPGGDLDPEPRWATWARSGEQTYLCTHLSTHQGAKRLQLEALAGIVRALPPSLVLLGDLNQPARHLGPLRAAGLRGDGRRHLTHSAAWPRRQIDWVLAGRGAKVLSGWALRSRASDHLPLVAGLEV